MDLLAQAATDATANGGAFGYWEKMLFDRGPLYVVFGLIVWLVIRYGPSLAEGHRSLMRTLEDNSRQNANSTERITETLEDLAARGKDAHSDMRQVKQAIRHGMAAGERLLIKSGEKTDSDVIIELRRGQNVLQNGDV